MFNEMEMIKAIFDELQGLEMKMSVGNNQIMQDVYMRLNALYEAAAKREQEKKETAEKPEGGVAK